MKKIFSNENGVRGRQMEFDTLIAKIESHRAAMKSDQEHDRKSGDAFVNGYNCGIQDGLEAAINILKQMVVANG